MQKLSDYIKENGRQKSAEVLDYAPETLDKAAKRDTIVVNGKVYGVLTKRKSRGHATTP